MMEIDSKVFPTTTKLHVVLDNKKNEGRLYYITSKRKLFVTKVKYVVGMDFRILTEALLFKRETEKKVKQERRLIYKLLINKLRIN